MKKSRNTILCVDDEKIVLDSLKTQLKSIFGDAYNYEIAQNAKEALEVVDDLKFEAQDVVVVISDYVMPGMYGDEFLIKLHEKHPNIKKIMLTGQADDNAVKRAREGANLLFCLRKPWSEAELSKIIKLGLNG